MINRVSCLLDLGVRYLLRTSFAEHLHPQPVLLILLQFLSFLKGGITVKNIKRTSGRHGVWPEEDHRPNNGLDRVVSVKNGGSVSK